MSEKERSYLAGDTNHAVQSERKRHIKIFLGVEDLDNSFDIIKINIIYIKKTSLTVNFTKRQTYVLEEMKKYIELCAEQGDRIKEYIYNTEKIMSGRTIEHFFNHSIHDRWHIYNILKNRDIHDHLDAQYSLVENSGKPLDEEISFNLNESYRAMVAKFSKSLFDCFARGPIIEINCASGIYKIALCKITFFWWMRKYSVDQYISKTLVSVNTPTSKHMKRCSYSRYTKDTKKLKTLDDSPRINRSNFVEMYKPPLIPLHMIKC